MTREDVVQAALTVERWCQSHADFVIKANCVHYKCDCPFNCEGFHCEIQDNGEPLNWGLEEFLRTRGMKHETE